jgi:Nitroreductase family
MEPWDLSDEEFPAAGTLEDKLAFVLRYALLAPSNRNTQPWRFRIGGDAIELFADATRDLPSVDPDHRQVVISCGASLYHLRSALRHFGFAPRVDFAPARSKDDFLARVTVSPSEEPHDHANCLFDAIVKRRTHRQPFDGRPVLDPVIEQLRKAAFAEGAWLQPFVSESAKNTIANLIAEGDTILFRNRRYRRELASWIHGKGDQRADGVDATRFGLRSFPARAAPLVISVFDIGNMQAEDHALLARDAPLLVVLGTAADDVHAWLATGQALARILLLGRSLGVWASFLNQPIEVPRLRADLLELARERGFPQIVLRMGYGEDLPPSPRRPVGDVLDP